MLGALLWPLVTHRSTPHRPAAIAGALITAAISLGSGSAVQAHGIESSLQRLDSLNPSVQWAPAAANAATGTNATALAAGTTLRLESHYSSGLPAQDALVRLVPPNGGTPIEVGYTNAQGQLRFRLPAGARPDWEVQVDAGPGHRDYLDLPSQTPGATAQHHQPGLFTMLAQHGATLVPGMIGGVAMVGVLSGLWLRRRRGSVPPRQNG